MSHSIQPLVYNAGEPQYEQTADWTCAACSLAWLNRALGIQHATDEFSAAEYIGIPDHINSLYGLMDASGSRLVQCFREQGAPAFALWPSWAQVFELASYMPLLLGGVGWYHWVGVRGANMEGLALANSAPGWQDVYQQLNEWQWHSLVPWAAVPVPLLHNFPPPPSS